MLYKNLTPHAVVLANGVLQITFEKEVGSPTARLEQNIEAKTIEHEVSPGLKISMPVNAVTRSEVLNLPEPEEGVILIVSTMIASHVKRPDVISPLTDSTCERDANGRVLSVRGFQTFN